MYLTKYYSIVSKKSGKKVLVNSLFGEIDEITDEIADAISALKKDIDAPVSEEAKTYLKSRNYLLESQEEEDRAIEEVKETYYQMSGCDGVTFFNYITYDCNLRCKYCCYRYLERNTPVMSKKMIDSSIHAMKTIKKDIGKKYSRTILSGGEPLLPENKNEVIYFMQKMREFIKEEKQEGREAELTIFSNGTGVPEYRDVLEEYKEEISLVFVTLNGKESTHDQFRIHKDGRGSFQEVVKGINTLLEIGINVVVVTNAGRTSMDNLEQMYDVSTEQQWIENEHFLGCFVSRIKDHKQFNEDVMSETEMILKLVRMVRQKKLKSEFFNFGDLKQLKIAMYFLNYVHTHDKKWFYHQLCGCNNKTSQYSMAVDGRIYTCAPAMGIPKYAEGTFYPEFKLRSQSGDTWNHISFLDRKKCRDCPVGFLCGGGCAFEAIEKNGNQENSTCSQILEVIKEIYNNGDEVKLLHKDFLYD